jgi:hypothetical protein
MNIAHELGLYCRLLIDPSRVFALNQVLASGFEQMAHALGSGQAQSERDRRDHPRIRSDDSQHGDDPDRRGVGVSAAGP